MKVGAASTTTWPSSFWSSRAQDWLSAPSQSLVPHWYEEWADAQHLDPNDRRHLQEESIVRRVEQLVAELPAPPALVEAKPDGTHAAFVVVEALSGHPDHPRGPALD